MGKWPLWTSLRRFARLAGKMRHMDQIDVDWDIYCRVIDNYGDAGVCYRLACQLVARGQSVRLFIDDPTPLPWMRITQSVQPVVLPFPAGISPSPGVARQVISGFGCDLPDRLLAAMVRAQQAGHLRSWLYLEYLSAQDYAATSHGLGSYVTAGAGAGLRRHFFFPGFTPATGGLLREPDLPDRQHRFARADWLAAHGVRWQGEPVYSLFCYEPPALANWLGQIGGKPGHLLVTPGRATAAVRALASSVGRQTGGVQIHELPWLSQDDFDHLLWSSDLNLVRGEDSLVRGVWAGKAMVWQAYPQEDFAERDKLNAFLDFFMASDDLRRFSECWNGVSQGPLPVPDVAGWTRQTLAARQNLQEQTDLVSRLLRFVAESR
jgi:uncharacterized repeat protein (TIGR03837 family)